MAGIDSCLQRFSVKDNQRLDGSTIEDVRVTLDVKQGILDEEVQPIDGWQRKRCWASQRIQHANEPVEIDFEDEIRVMVLLSSLPEAWDGLVMAVSNSCGT